MCLCMLHIPYQSGGIHTLHCSVQNRVEVQLDLMLLLRGACIIAISIKRHTIMLVILLKVKEFEVQALPTMNACAIIITFKQCM